MRAIYDYEELSYIIRSSEELGVKLSLEFDRSGESLILVNRAGPAPVIVAKIMREAMK